MGDHRTSHYSFCSSAKGNCLAFKERLFSHPLFHIIYYVHTNTFRVLTVLSVSAICPMCDSCPTRDDGSMRWYRLLQSSHVGVKDGPGGAGRAGEVESPRSVADHVGQQCHVDPGGFPLVHLSLHWRFASGGESLVPTHWDFSFFLYKLISSLCFECIFSDKTLSL